MNNTNEISFEIDSKFFKEISNRYDELLIYKSNYIDFLLTQELFKKEITEPEVVTGSKGLYLNKIKDYAKQREVFDIKGYATYTASGPNGETYDIAFNVVETGLDSAIVNGKFQSKKKLILRFRKGLKVTVNLNNMEAVLLGGIENNTQQINTVDYAKTILDLKNYQELNRIITDTKENYNKEYFKHFDNTIKSLNNFKVHNVSTENVTTEFSQTIGFSIKSLTYEDIKNLELEQKNTKTIKITGADLYHLLSAVKYDRQWRRENLHQKFKNWIKDNTVPGSQYTKQTLFLRNDLSPGLYLDGMIKVERNNANDANGRFTLYYYKKTLKKELFNQDSYYTVSYFSAFKSKEDDEETKNSTYFKKSVQSNHVISVKGNNENYFISTPLKDKSKTIYNFDIKTFNDDQLESRIKSFVYRVDATTDDTNKTKEIKAINSKINKKKSGVDRFLKSFKVDSEDGSLSVLVNNVIVLDRETDYEAFQDLLKSNTIDSENYHFFVPEVCLETLTGRVLLEKKIIEEKDNVIEINSKQSILGKKYEIFYRVSLDDIYKNLQTTSKNNIRVLTPFYGSKWFYQENLPYKSETIARGQNKVKYPKFYYNLTWAEGSVEITGEGKRSFIGKPLISVNGKLIGASGGSKGIEKNPSPIGDQKKQEELKGPEEKVLKISKVGSSLEYKRLPGAFNNAKSKEDASSADIIDMAINKKPEIDSVSLKTDFADLNAVDEKNLTGKENSSGYDNVSYVKNRRSLYKFRRSNIQPKLIKIINEAVEITKAKYPDLLSAEILSMSSPSANLSAKVYILSKAGNTAEIITQKLNSTGFNGIKLNDNDIKDIVSGFNKKGSDNNHANGLAADVFLKRKVENGSTKYVCLYEPNDDKDFEIVNTFLTVCKHLGASGLGAGMYYMDYPEFLTHKTKKYVQKLLNGNKSQKRLGNNIKDLYEQLNIEYANESSDGKIIVSSTGIPIRSSKTNHKNAFHVDILSDIYSFFEDSSLDETISNIDVISDKYKKSLTNDAKSKIASFKKDVNAYKEYKSNKRASLPSKSRVWGENYRSETADKWLKDIVSNSTASNPAFNIEEITTKNFEEYSKKQFEAGHPASKDKQGNIVSSKYVSVDDIQKK